MNNIRLLIFLLIITANSFGQSQTNNSLNSKFDNLYNTFFKKDGPINYTSPSGAKVW
jgi:hypothetical protein